MNNIFPIMFVFLALSGFASSALAQFAYECFPSNGKTFISKDRCPEGMQWRKIQTDPYYTAPVTKVYERPVQPTANSQAPIVVTRQASPYPTVQQGTTVQAPPAPVQQGYSNEELSRELNERYKDYGGYRPGYKLQVGKDGKSYQWYK
jgi:hypothetical protein